MPISCPYCLEDNDAQRDRDGSSIVCRACGARFDAPQSAGAPAAKRESNELPVAPQKPDEARRMSAPPSTMPVPAGSAPAPAANKAEPYRLSREKPKRSESSEEAALAALSQPAEQAADPSAAENFVLVVCPICATRMHPRREHIGKKCKCPDCGTVVRIQPPPPPPPATERQPDEIGAYSVAAGEVDLERFGAEKYFGVTCPTCGTRLNPRRDQAGKRTRCPDCFKVFRIPEAPPLAKPRTPESTGQYNVSQADAWDYAGTEHDSSQFFETHCPYCNTRMTPRRQDVGTRLTCPDCKGRFDVPLPPPPPGMKVPLPPKPYVASDIEAAPPVTQRPSEPVQPRAIAERIPIAPIPDWPFLSGTFSFPFRSDGISRWAATSTGFLVMGALYTVGMTWKSIIALVLLVGLPLMLATLFSLAYAAANFMAIMNETAEGADEITGWAEGFREWFTSMMLVGYILALSFSIGYGTGWLQLQLTGRLGMWWPIVGAAMFPFFLLSSQEVDLPIVPFSRPILLSLFRNTADWIKFYLLSMPLLGGWLFIVLSLEQDYPTLAVLVAGPMLAAVIFIYARLLGRLAWKAAHT